MIVFVEQFIAWREFSAAEVKGQTNGGLLAHGAIAEQQALEGEAAIARANGQQLLRAKAVGKT